MPAQIWSKVEDKWAYILTLDGHEVHRLKVTGNMLTLKRNIKAVMDALGEGKAPSAAGAKSVESLDARTISKAELAPGHGSLTLHGAPGQAQTLAYTTGDNDADAILRAILAQSGRTFEPTHEPIGVGEALLPPGIAGLVGGGIGFALYDSAAKVAAGREVEVNGIRRRGLKKMLINIAEVLGTTGSIAVGVLAVALALAWAVRRITHRPQRTVWMPTPA